MSKSKSSFHEYGDALLLGGLTNSIQIADSIVLGDSPLLFKYLNIACGRYVWDNLPEGVESRDIELRLLLGGRVFVTDTTKYGLIFLSAKGLEFNIYNKPVKVLVTGLGFNEEFATSEGVLINDNLTPDFPSFYEVARACHLLDEIDKTIHMNLGQQKFPIIFQKTSNTELSVKQFGEKAFNEFFPFQFVDKRMEKALGDKLENIKALNTDVPFLLDKLQDFRQSKESEILSYLGINNVSIFKKERLISDEANSNNDFIKMNLEIGYQERLKAVEKINERYGTNIQVRKYTDILPREEELSNVENEQE